MKIKISLFYKFVIIMVILAVVPLGVVGMLLINVNESALQNAILELHTSLATSLSEKIDDYITSLKSKLSFIITSQKVLDMSWAGKQVLLQSLLEANSDFVDISIVDNKGNELIKVVNEKLEKNPSLMNHLADQTFQGAIKGKPEISPVYYSEHQPRINVAYPFGENQVIFVVLSLQKLWDSIYKTSIGTTGLAFLVDDKGRIIAHPQIVNEEKFTDVSGLEIIKAALSGQIVGSKEYTDNKNVEMIGAYAPVKTMNWGLIVQQNKTDAYWSVIVMRRKALFAVLLTSIGAALIGLLLARTLSGPVLKLIRGAEKISQGDFSGTVEVRTHDEMQTLADTFNLMTGRLKEYNELQIDRIIAERSKTAAVIYSISDGLIMTDFTGKIMLLNQPARKLLNIKETDIEERDLFAYINNEQLKNVLKEIIEKKEETIVREISLSGENPVKTIRSTADTVVTEKGKKLGVVTVLHDITLEKEIESMKEDFMSSITHDLRSPMTSIRGFLEVLLGGSAGELSGQQKEFLGIIDNSSKRLLDMINDILDVAKLESGRMDLMLEEVDFNEMICKILKELQPLVSKGKISLVSQGLDDLQKVMADYSLLERVIINLVGNAIKFTPPEKNITILGENLEDKIKISIIDTGEGIPSDYVEKVFDKFQQVTQGKKKRKGTGLGLTICRYVIESHKGKIWAESEFGKGSTFTFWIPKNLRKDDNGEVIV
jgi:signal transduction histidine kinase